MKSNSFHPNSLSSLLGEKSVEDVGSVLLSAIYTPAINRLKHGLNLGFAGLAFILSAIITLCTIPLILNFKKTAKE